MQTITPSWFARSHKTDSPETLSECMHVSDKSRAVVSDTEKFSYVCVFIFLLLRESCTQIFSLYRRELLEKFLSRSAKRLEFENGLILFTGHHFGM